MSANFSSLFNKKLDQVTIEDLHLFFSTEQEETSTLEFKTGDVTIVDLCKEIASFLNTEGGHLVIGSPKEQTRKREGQEVTYCIGDLIPSATFRSRDWLAQKINSNISPAPAGFFGIQALNLNGGFIFVINVLQSTNPPHQVSAQGKYYIRMDRHSVPAPHGLVQALFNKRKLPKLETEIEIRSTNFGEDLITIVIKNTSSQPTENIGSLIQIYNVHEVTGYQSKKLISGIGVDYFEIHNQKNMVLVRALNFTAQLSINHYSLPYLIKVDYWSRDVDSLFTFCYYNPSEKKIISRGDEMDQLAKAFFSLKAPE